MSGLVDLLTGPDARAALVRHDIGAVYRILIAAGVGQARIAQATGQRQPEVSAVVNGRRVQSIALLERIADGLGVPRGWMGLAYTAGREPEPAPEEQPSEEEQQQNLLRHAAVALFGAPVFGDPRPVGARDRSTPRPARIGTSDVQRLMTITARLQRLDTDFGGSAFSDMLTRHAQASEALLGAEMREQVRRQLLVALSDIHGAASWAASDAGLRDRARDHHMRGMSCANVATDRERLSNHLRGAGRAELQFGEPNEALKLFQLGAATASSPLFHAVFQSNAAVALARLGLADQARDALSRARHALGVVPEKWRLLADGLTHSTGRAHILIGSFDAAVTDLTAAVDSAGHAKRCSTLNFAELATAQLRAGELREGVRTAAVVIDNARTLRSVWVRARLAPLQRAAAARRDSACQDVARELATLRAA